MLKEMTAEEFEKTWRGNIEDRPAPVFKAITQHFYTYWNVCPICNSGILNNEKREINGISYFKIYSCPNESCNYHFKFVPIGNYIDAKVYYSNIKEEVEQAN